MRKTLSRKKINGSDYYYLSYRIKGKLHTEYLGNGSSTKFRKYLFSLTEAQEYSGVRKAKATNFRIGAPICYAEDGFLILEYKNGAKEFFDQNLRRIKVVMPNG
jgi:hypothetical protein